MKKGKKREELGRKGKRKERKERREFQCEKLEGIERDIESKKESRLRDRQEEG